MNPGLLDQRVRLERLTSTTDALGQPVDSWAIAGSFRARRKPEKVTGEAVEADRDTEKRRILFHVRSQPFVSLYQAGDRLVEIARTDFPETVWSILGWAEIDGTRGMYVEIQAETLREASPGGSYLPETPALPDEIDGGSPSSTYTTDLDGGLP